MNSHPLSSLFPFRSLRRRFRTGFALLLVSTLLCLHASAMILVKIDGIAGDSQVKGYDDGKWFLVDSFDWNVDRSLADIGKGGTADVDLGPGELSEVGLNKVLDKASTYLLAKAISGMPSAKCEIHFVGAGGVDVAVQPFLIIKMENVFVKSLSTSAGADERPTEQCELYCSRIHFKHLTTTDGKTWTVVGQTGWDRAANKPWTPTW